MLKSLRYFARLRTRLAIIVAAALAPAGVLAISQALDALAAAEERRTAAFEAAALREADEERVALVAIREATRKASLATRAAIETGGDCAATLELFFQSADWAVAPAIYSRDGAPICGASEANVSEKPVWRRFRQTRDYALSTFGAALGDRAAAFLAFRAVPGSRDLALGVGVDFGFLRSLIEPAPDGRRFALIGIDGDALTPVGRADVEWLPDDRRALQTLGDRPVTAVAADAAPRRYHVSVLEPGQLWAVSAAQPRSFAERYFSREALAAAAPLVLWLIAVGVAYFAIDALVTRHVSDLRRAAVRIGEGDLEAPIRSFSDAPLEIQSLGRAVSVMRDKIAEREASLTETLDVQRRLILEVHHRVKNNLQMISSLMNLESRRAVDPESKTAMATIQNRIHSLAMVHQNLYAAERLEEVALDQLARDIVEHLAKSLAPKQAREAVSFDLEPLTASTTHATPIALFLSEAVGNAFKHGEAPFDLRVALKNDRGAFELMVSNRAGPESEAKAKSESLGLKLMRGFAKQIGARFSAEATEGRFVVRLSGEMREKGDVFAVRRAPKA